MGSAVSLHKLGLSFVRAPLFYLVENGAERVCNLQSHLLPSSAFTKLLLNLSDFTEFDCGMGELLQVFAAGPALETFKHCLRCASGENSALMPSPNTVTAALDNWTRNASGPEETPRCPLQDGRAGLSLA